MSSVMFNDFLKSLDGVLSPKERISTAGRFMAEAGKGGTPLFETDRDVVFLYQGSCSSVKLTGDMTNWAENIPLIRIEGTDIFYLKARYESDARLQYQFILDDGDEAVLDPLNPRRSANGLWLMSELAMPSYTGHPLFADYTDGTEGGFSGLAEYVLPEGALPYPHTINIHLPNGYGADTGRNFPVLYFQDGPDYIRFAHVSRVLDQLAAAGEIEPAIAVFVTPPNLHVPKEPNRSTEYGLNKDYLKFFADELVPFVDGKFRTIDSPEGRTVIGDSYGGLVSLWIAFERSGLFGSACSQSGYHSFDDDRIIKLIGGAEKRNIRIFIDIGIYEKRVGADFLPERETDFLSANRRLNKLLLEKGYDFIYKEYNEGHTWGNWRVHLIDALKYLRQGC